MTDQELIKALRGEAVTLCHITDYLPETADRLEALLAENERLKAQLPKWVSVEERLPETNDFVLVTFTGWIGKKEYIGGYLLAEYAHGDGWILEECPQLENPNVTHWMPLPEPPSTEGVE